MICAVSGDGIGEAEIAKRKLRSGYCEADIAIWRLRNGDCEAEIAKRILRFGSCGAGEVGRFMVGLGRLLWGDYSGEEG